jgi:hypothetical protein
MPGFSIITQRFPNSTEPSNFYAINRITPIDTLNKCIHEVNHNGHKILFIKRSATSPDGASSSYYTIDQIDELVEDLKTHGLKFTSGISQFLIKTQSRRLVAHCL